MSTDPSNNAIDGCTPETILSRVDEAICALNADYEVTFVNEQAAQFLDCTADELLGQSVWEAVPDITETAVGDELRESMATQTPTRFESYNETLDRWVEVRIYPDEDGATACFYDITDERGRQLDLQRQRRLFETVFAETEDALVVADTDRRITDFNPAAEELFGYEASEVIGEKTRMLYADPATYEQQGDERFNEDAASNEETYPVEYELADGTTFIGETLGTPLNGPDNETLAFLASIRDATTRIAYEAQIEAGNDSLREFHDITTDDNRSFAEQLEALLALGTEYLGLDVGIYNTVDGSNCTVEYVTEPEDTIQPGDTFDLGNMFCEVVVDAEEQVAITNAGDNELTDHPAYQAQDIEAYIGTPIRVDGEQHGTINFSQSTPRSQPFSANERTFIDILAQWIGKELSRKRSQDRAAANRDRLRQIIDLLPQLVFAKDQDNEFILANQAVADAYGTTVEGVEGSTDADFADDPSEVEQFKQDDIAVIDSGERKVIPQEPLTTADGETKILKTIKIPYDPVDHDTEAVLGVATDITEATQRERELEATTRRLTIALEATQTGVWEFNRETEEVIWTDSMEELLGVAPDEYTDTFKTLLNRVYPEDLPAVKEALAEPSADGDTIQIEYRFETGDGTYVWLEVRAELIVDDTGAERLVGIATDISDRKERTVEIELQSAAMEVAMDGIAILDGDEYVYMNEAHAAVFDATPGELIGQTWQDLYGDDEIERLEADVFPELAETGSWQGETTGQTLDGTPVKQDLGLSLLDSGELICTNRDITAQKQREAELQQQRTRIRALFDNSPDSIVIHDSEGAILDINDTMVDTLGYDRATISAMNVAEFEVGIEQADLMDIWAGMEFDETLKVEGTHRRENGETFPVEVWVNKLAVGGDPRYIAVSRDISVRKQREAELKRSQEFLTRAQESAAIGGWEIDLEADSLRWTDEVYRIHDLPLDASVSIDEAVEFYHPDDRPALEAAFERLTAEGESYDLELRIVTAEDRVRWVRTVGDPQFDEEGEVVGVVGVFQDISEQKRLERSLRDSEQAVRELTSIGADTDRSFDKKITALLELGTEQLGLPIGFLNRLDDDTQHIQQAVGNHPAIQTGASAPRSESYCRKTVQQSGPLDVQDAAAEGWEGDAAYDRFDLGCYIGGTITVDGEMYGTLCFADHNSRAHEFSDNERAFVKLLVQWVSHELTTKAFETRLHDINETAQELMAVPNKSQIAALTVESTQSILGTSISGIWWYDEEQNILDPVLHTDAAAEHVQKQPVFEPGDALAWEAFESGEMQVYNDLADVDGKHNEATIFESEVIVPLGDHGVLSASSLTPRAFSEADRNLLEVLASTIESALTRAEREMLLRETRAELEQSNEELEQFAYAASHDLQEPLRTVSSYLTLLERRYGDELDGDAAEFIEFAVDGADRMQGMIQALLAYSRVDTSGESFEPVAVSTLLTSVTQSLDVKITEANATVSIPDTDARVTGDENQLAQLFQNLIENGIKYNTDEPEIDISVHRDGTDVAIEITDNGIGIPADKRDGIFEVFQRLHTREEFTGTGIGLSICRKIVDRHDGDITVDSEPDVGSTFTITLPNGAAMDE